MRRRWIAPLLLAGVGVLLGGAYLAAGSQPVLRWALEQAKSAGLTVDAAQIGGNLLSGVTATDARVKSAFVNGSAKTVTARYDLWALITKREVRLNASLEGGDLNFDPGKLPVADASGAAPPVTVSLESINLKDVSVKVFNRVFASPDVRVTVLEQKPIKGQTLRGDLKLALSSSGGTGTADVRYDIGKDFAVNLSVNADLDAKMARFYYEPIRAGRVRGQLTVTPKFVSAAATISDGVLEPVGGFFVRGIGGRANLTSDEKVSALLTGTALGGQLEADLAVDIKAERWNVIGKLQPSVKSTLETFAAGTDGTGRLAVTVRGGGWETVSLSGTVTGTPNTSVAGFALRALNSNWRYTDRLEATASAITTLVGQDVALNAKITTRGERVLVDAKANGKLLEQPLTASAKIDVLNGVTSIDATGKALRGQVSVAGNINGERLNLSSRFAGLQLPVPFQTALTGNAKATGTTRDLRITGLLSEAIVRVPNVKKTAYPGAFKLLWNGQRLSGDARLADGDLTWRGAILNQDGSSATGDVTLNRVQLEPAGVVAARLGYALNADGSGDLRGAATARQLALQGARLEEASGPLTLEWTGAKVTGRWDADKLLATLTERDLRVQPRNWGLSFGGQSLALGGDIKLGFEDLTLTGGITGRGALGDITATGRGSSLELSGTARFERLRVALNGAVDLEPFALRLALRPSSLAGDLGGSVKLMLAKTLQASGTVTTGRNKRLEFALNGADLKANGELDVSALDNVLPAGSRGLARGVARFSYANEVATATFTGAISNQALTAQLEWRDGRVTTTNARLTGGDFSGARVSGQLFPSVDATVAYDTLTARVTGGYDDLRFTATGAAPKIAALEDARVSLRGQRVTARGRFAGGALTGSFELGDLRISSATYRDGAFNAQIFGTARGQYEGRNVTLERVNGRVSYGSSGLKLTSNASRLTGSYANDPAKLEVAGYLQAVKLEVTQSSRAIRAKLTGSSGAISGRYDMQPFTARGLGAMLNLNNNALQVNFTARAAEGGYADARARLEGLRGAVTQVDGGNFKLTAQSSSGTAIYAGERALLSAINASLNLSGSRLTTGFDAAFSASPRGEAVTGKLSGTLGLNLEQSSLEQSNLEARQAWDGAVKLTASGENWRVAASGPWARVRVDAVAPTATLAKLARVTLPTQLETVIRAQGFASLPAQTYQATFSSALGQDEQRLALNGRVGGIKTAWQANVTVSDAKSGTASLSYNSTGRGSLNISSLELAALTQTSTTLSGALELRGENIAGNISGAVAGLPVSARWNDAGAFIGSVGGPVPLTLRATRWAFPLEVSPIAVSSGTVSSGTVSSGTGSSGTDSPASITGTLQLTGGIRFAGDLELRPVSVTVPGGAISLPAQRFPVTFSALDGLRANLSGDGSALTFNGKTWGGGLNLRYRTWGKDATLTVTAAGALGDPTLNLETRGDLNLEGSVSLKRAELFGSLKLEGLTGALEPHLRAQVVAGRLQFKASGNPSALTGTVSANLNGSSVDGEAARLTFDAAYKGGLTAQGQLALGASSTRFTASEQGLSASQIDLDLRLLRLFGITASGAVRGSLELPAYDLGRSDGVLELIGANAFNAALDGSVTVQAGRVSSDLRGRLPGDLPIAVRGALYPSADATLELDGLTGRVTGSNLGNPRIRAAALALSGRFQQKTASLSANLQAGNLKIDAAWDALRVALGGRLNDSGVRLVGSVNASDLSGLTGTVGNLSARLEVDGLTAKLRALSGSVAGFKIDGGAAAFENGALRLEGLGVRNADFTASAKGLLFPKLEASATLESRNVYAPGKFSATASGTLAKPVVTLSGQLEAAKIGLITPDTRVAGKFDGQSWTVNLNGKAITANARGNLNAVQAVTLEGIDAPVAWDGSRVNLKGAGAYSAQTGFAGKLNASGELIGSPAVLNLTGNGALNARLEWRGGKLNATLPAQVSDRVNTGLEFERFDVAALWNKPKQLWLAGTGRVTGIWSDPRVELNGAVSSADQSLDSRLTLRYGAGEAALKLSGERVDVDANLTGTAYSASGNFQGVRLEALLPFPAKSLALSGAVQISGKLNGGWAKLALSNLDLRGEIAPIGAFSATGNASSNASFLSADLLISALSGTVRANGRVGAQGSDLKLTAQDINLEPLGIAGAVAGQLTLRGATSDPTVSGTVSAKGLTLPNLKWGANATAQLSARLLEPNLTATLDLTGNAKGRLQLSARNLLSARPNVSLRGLAALPDGSFNINLEGVFPALSGSLEAILPALPVAVQRVKLEGDGKGAYRVDNEALSGQVKLTAGKTLLETALSGTLAARLELSALQAGLTGRATGDLNVGGTVSDPKASLSGLASQLALSGITAPDVKLTAQLEGGKLAARGVYAGGAVNWDGQRVDLTGLPLTFGEYALTVAATGTTAPLDLSLTSKLGGGGASGALTGRYAAGTLDLRLEAALNGLALSGGAQGDPQRGWSGAISVNGLPKDSLLGQVDAGKTAGTAALSLSGAFSSPTLKGTVQTLGGQLEVTAALTPLAVNLRGVTGFTGALELRGGALSGTLGYDENDLKLALQAAGTLEQPNATLSASYGQASATANLRLEAGQPQGTLRLTDGAKVGNFTVQGGRVFGAAQELDLSSLKQAGFGGTVSVQGDVRQDASATYGWRGALSATWDKVVTPFTVPILEWNIDGTGKANLDFDSGAVALEYAGSPGTANAKLRLQNGLWVGSVAASLRGKSAAGSIDGAVTLASGQINGSVTAANLPLELLGVPVTVSGAVTLEKDSFSATGTAQTLGGQITATGSGGLSDLAPFLQPYTKTAPGDLGYTVRARLDTVKLEDIDALRAVAPGVTGRAIGVVQITDGIGNFQLSVPELNLPDLTSNPKDRVRLGLRITGTAAGSNLRYNGRLVGLPSDAPSASLQPNFDGYGESLFSGSYDGERASGLIEMRRAPLHSVIGSVFGALPGRAVATGIARYDIPFRNFAQSEVRVALERLEIEGGGDKLTGFAAANFKNGNLTLDQLDLRGKGRWTGAGRYTRESVDLKLNFENTSFTPVLALIPTLREYNPDASGTVRLELSGKYALPDAQLTVSNFKGRLSGIALSAPSLSGSLKDGALSVTGTLSSDDTLGAVLETTATAKVTSLIPTNVTNLEGRLKGSLNVRPIGLIENVDARVFGASGGFKLDATGQKGGALSVTGDLSPLLNLKLSGRNLIVPVPDYFVSDSLMDADLGFRGDGLRAYVLTGNVNILRLSAALNQPARSTAKPGTPSATPAQTKNPFLEQIKLGSVRVTAPQGIRLNESFAALEAGGTLTLSGTAAAPEATGQLEALGLGGRGFVRLGANSYTIQTAVANFSPSEGIFPVISVNSVGKLRAALKPTLGEVRVMQEISVNLKLDIRWIPDAAGVRKLVVEPALSSNKVDGFEELTITELNSLVTLGSTLGNANVSFSGLGQQALDTAFSLFFLSEFSRQFKDATGVDLIVSTNLFDYIFNPPDTTLDKKLQTTLNFTFNLGFDLSRAVRLNVEVGTAGKGAVNLNYQSDDGRFGIRFNTPFDLNTVSEPRALYGGLQPEFGLSYNISSLNAFTLGFQYRGDNNFSIKFGFSFRF